VRREAAYGSSSKVQAGSGPTARTHGVRVYVSRGVHIETYTPSEVEQRATCRLAGGQSTPPGSACGRPHG
jgi:hypothetical protein